MKPLIICAALVATVATAVAMRSGPLERSARAPRAAPMPSSSDMRDSPQYYDRSKVPVSMCVTVDLVMCSPYWDVGNPASKQSDLPPYGNQ